MTISARLGARLLTTAILLGASSLGGAGCGDDSTTGSNDMAASVCTGAPVTGGADTHCDATGGMAAIMNVVDPAECSVDAGAPAGGPVEAPVTLYNTSGKDDDCKYTVSYTVDPICENQGVSFTVTVKNLVGGSPVTGAKTHAEVFLDDTHPAPNSNATTTETAPGVYKITPVKFDKAGKWTVRFHFFEACADSETSPHGHVAFFVNVP